MLSTNRNRIAVASAVAAALAVAAAPAASAKGGGGVRVAGTCSASSTSLLKAKPDNGRLEVEFEVDQNRTGVAWNVTLLRSGTVAFAGTRTTAAPSGSFSVQRRVAGGTPILRARATRNGETCSATLRIRPAATTAAAVAVRGDGTADDTALAAVAVRGDGTVDDTALPAGQADDRRGGTGSSGPGSGAGRGGADDRVGHA